MEFLGTYIVSQPTQNCGVSIPSEQHHHNKMMGGKDECKKTIFFYGPKGPYGPTKPTYVAHKASNKHWADPQKGECIVCEDFHHQEHLALSVVHEAWKSELFSSPFAHHQACHKCLFSISNMEVGKLNDKVHHLEKNVSGAYAEIGDKQRLIEGLLTGLREECMKNERLKARVVELEAEKECHHRTSQACIAALVTQVDELKKKMAGAVHNLSC